LFIDDHAGELQPSKPNFYHCDQDGQHVFEVAAQYATDSL
jgi:hypothetical protein